MKLFRRASSKNMQLVFLLKSANYNEIINLLEKGTIKYSELEEKDIKVIFDDAIKTDNVRTLVTVFEILDNSQKQDAIRCFGKVGIAVPQNIIQTDLKLFLRISLEEDFDRILLDILKVMLEQVNRYRREIASIKDYLASVKNSQNECIVQMNELICKDEFDRLFQKRNYYRYFETLDVNDKKLHIRYFMEEKPDNEIFANFVVNTNCLDIIIYSLLSSNFSMAEKSSYLFTILELTQEKEPIINLLLSFNDAEITKQLKQKYLFDISGKIVNIKLLRLYLSDNLSESEFRQFLYRIVDYKLVLETIGNLDLNLEVRNAYLRCLLQIEKVPYKDKIREELKKYDPQNVGDPFTDDKEETQEQVASSKVEGAVEERMTGFASESQEKLEEALNIATPVADEAPLEYSSGTETVGTTVLNDPNEQEIQVDAAATTSKILEEEIPVPPNPCSYFINKVPIVDANFSLEEYLLSLPSIVEFKMFIEKNNNLKDVYEQLIDYTDIVDHSFLSEYLYVIFKLNKEEYLVRDIVEDILILGVKDVCKRVMEDIGPVEQEELIQWAYKSRNLQITLMLASVTNCAGTYSAVEFLFNVPNVETHLALVLNLDEEYLNYGLSVLLKKPNEYLRLLHELYEATKKDEFNVSRYLDKLKKCVEAVFNAGADSLFADKDVEMMRNILTLGDEEMFKLS